jgi:hypothetical protein
MFTNAGTISVTTAVICLQERLNQALTLSCFNVAVSKTLKPEDSSAVNCVCIFELLLYSYVLKSYKIFFI